MKTSKLRVKNSNLVDSEPSFSSLPKTSNPLLSDSDDTDLNQPTKSNPAVASSKSPGNSGKQSRSKVNPRSLSSPTSKSSKISSASNKNIQSKVSNRINVKASQKLNEQSVSKPAFRYAPKLSVEENRDFRSKLERAIRLNRIFTLDSTPVYAQIRRSLVQRGWVEKNTALAILFASQTYGVRPRTEASLTDSIKEESKQAWINRALSSHPPDFIWSLGRARLNFLELNPNQLVNQFPHSSMTTKVGITAFLQSSHWVSEAGTANTYFPRCYRLAISEERRAFISDFYLTACMAFLQWVVGAYEKEGENGIMAEDGKIDGRWAEFCLKQISNYIRVRKHEDIDWQTTPFITVPGTWNTFLENQLSITSDNAKLKKSTKSSKELYDKSKQALQSVAPFWPQLNIDGVNNLWIIKPAASSRGNGIHVTNQLKTILKLLTQAEQEQPASDSTAKRTSHWVVQKYIERPLLIYQTKFDIRQWFIVYDWNPMSVWFYRECYLRFSSQIFTLDNLHRSIHLCNNVVQRKFKNTEIRDPALPEENMWDNYTFQAYLKTLGKENAWHEVIHPGMKRAILGVLLAGQDNFEFRKNCFELYGADFMVTEDFVPWLIEINGSPTMAASTTVTARMRNQVLEDCIKGDFFVKVYENVIIRNFEFDERFEYRKKFFQAVVVDHRQNPKAPTGMFELIYKQNYNTKLTPYRIGNATLGVRKLKTDGPEFSNHSVKVYEPKSVNGIVFSGEIPTLTYPLDHSTHSLKSNCISPELLIKRFKLTDPKLQPPLIVPSKIVFSTENSEVFPDTPPFWAMLSRNPASKADAQPSAINLPNIPKISAELSNSEKNLAAARKNPSTRSLSIAAGKVAAAIKEDSERISDATAADVNRMIVSSENENESTSPKSTISKAASETRNILESNNFKTISPKIGQDITNGCESTDLKCAVPKEIPISAKDLESIAANFQYSLPSTPPKIKNGPESVSNKHESPKFSQENQKFKELIALPAPPKGENLKNNNEPINTKPALQKPYPEMKKHESTHFKMTFQKLSPYMAKGHETANLKSNATKTTPPGNGKRQIESTIYKAIPQKIVSDLKKEPVFERLPAGTKTTTEAITTIKFPKRSLELSQIRPEEPAGVTYDCKNSCLASNNNNSAENVAPPAMQQSSKDARPNSITHSSGTSSPNLKSINVKSVLQKPGTSDISLHPNSPKTSKSSKTSKKHSFSHEFQLVPYPHHEFKSRSTIKRPSLKTKDSFVAKPSQKLLSIQNEDSRKRPYFKFRRHSKSSRTPHNTNPSDIFLRDMNLTASYLKKNYPPEHTVHPNDSWIPAGASTQSLGNGLEAPKNKDGNVSIQIELSQGGMSPKRTKKPFSLLNNNQGKLHGKKQDYQTSPERAIAKMYTASKSTNAILKTKQRNKILSPNAERVWKT